jgi:hypothetical protein
MDPRGILPHCLKKAIEGFDSYLSNPVTDVFFFSNNFASNESEERFSVRILVYSTISRALVTFQGISCLLLHLVVT